MGGKGTTGNYTMYVNPFMVVNSMKFTKHFYIEGQRIVSKLGDMGKNQDLLNPKDTARAGNNGNNPIDWDNKQEHLKDFLIENFEELGLNGAVFTAGKSGKVPYGQIKKYYRNSDGIIDGYGSDSTTARNYNGNKAELLQFYYHPDHLGSSNYITDVSGEVYQHMEYFPFGETFIEERNGTECTTYLYNGKEFDEEVGLYYYGARYYDPYISIFYGVDPLAEKYPNISGYMYGHNNPLKFIDPDGKDPIYAKNFWGRVRLIGDDGKKGTASYLVRGSVARQVKAATKEGNFYKGDLSESKKVMLIPTGQILSDVQHSANNTTNSGTSPDTRVENGAHVMQGDATARHWDSGTPVKISKDAEGNTTKTWSVTPFKIGGKKNQFGGDVSKLLYFWHIHPNSSTPSSGDKWWVGELRKYGFNGNSFLIDVKNDRVTFFNEKGTLIKVKYSDFIKMGNQMNIK